MTLTLSSPGGWRRRTLFAGATEFLGGGLAQLATIGKMLAASLPLFGSVSRAGLNGMPWPNSWFHRVHKAPQWPKDMRHRRAARRKINSSERPRKSELG